MSEKSNPSSTERKDPHGDLGYVTEQNPYADNGVRFTRPGRREAARVLDIDRDEVHETDPIQKLPPGPGVLDAVANEAARRRVEAEIKQGDRLRGPDGELLPEGPQSDIVHPDHRDSVSIEEPVHESPDAEQLRFPTE